MNGITSFSRASRPWLRSSVSWGLEWPAAAEDQPDFSGVWLFNEKRSDDLRALVEEAVGPDATQGDIKKDLVRVWIRRWLLSVIEDPDSRYLTVEQSPEDFKTGLGDEVSTYYFGRVAVQPGPVGRHPPSEGELERTGARHRGGLERRGPHHGRLHAAPPGNTLLIRYLLEHKTLQKPLEVRMFFDRDEEDE